MTRTLFVLMLLGGALSASAQTGAGKASTLTGGVCGTTNWVCVAECIDAACVDHCMREGCEQSLARLRVCTQKARCAPDDPTCSARMCGGTCRLAFEPAPRSPEKEKPEPCRDFKGQGGGTVPDKVVGRWELSAATLTAEPKEDSARLDPKPRSDYARTLEVTPGGCFVMRTKLDDATLGQGNDLEVRSWGAFSVEEHDKVSLLTKDGQAVGQVCNKPRVFGLSKGKFQGPRYKLSVEKDTLTLVAEEPSKHTFQFQRVTGEGDKAPRKEK